MPLSHRRRLRFWLVTPLLLLGLLFAIDAAYGQPGRPPGFPRTQPVNPALPPGITPAGPLPGGLPANPPVNPGAPGLAPGGPGGPGAKPGLPLPPGWGNNPGLNPPNGIPGNPGGVEVVRTCTVPSAAPPSRSTPRPRRPIAPNAGSSSTWCLATPERPLSHRPAVHRRYSRRP
jgi:hypothetical protein